jgi:predicted small integral membrane protein
MMSGLAHAFDWMAWTPPVAIFFVGLAVLLVAMGVWQRLSPTMPRRGWLPLQTTRGDRLFIGLLAAAFVNLAWIGATEMDPRIGAGIGFGVMAIIMRWG